MGEALHCLCRYRPLKNHVPPLGAAETGGIPMTIPERSIYPRSGDKETVYLRDVVTDPGISAGEYTI